MIFHQLVLKLQGLQTIPAKTVGVFAFYVHPFFMAQFWAAALAGGNIAHFALKWFGTTWATFNFMFIHAYYQLNVTPVLKRNGIALKPLASKNFFPVIFCASAKNLTCWFNT